MIYILIDSNNNVQLGSTVLPDDGQAWVTYDGVIPSGNRLIMVDGVLVTDPVEIAEMKVSKITELYEECDTGNALDIDYMGTVFQADKHSQDILANVLSVGSVPVDFYWVDLANNKVSMTFLELRGLGIAILERSQINFNKVRGLKAAVNRANDLSAIESVYFD